jgi:hypothetical protein
LARIQVFAAEDRGGDGIIPSLAILDELHRHRDLALYRTWRGKLVKRGAQMLVISTAGEPGSEFEETRERMRREAAEVSRSGRTFVRAAGPGYVLHDWSVPADGDVEDLGLVADANPLAAITVERLGEKRADPAWTLAHWRRFVCNLPTRQVAAAITEAEWANARTDVTIPPGEPVWVGLDVAWKHDTTAIVPLWEGPEFRLLGEATVLEPPRNGDMVSADAVRHALAELHARNPIGALVMDMAYAADIAQWASDELGLDVVDRSQKNSWLVRDYEAFMAGLRTGALRHSGCAGLTRHALNATARVLPDGKVRFDRPTASRAASLQQWRSIDALSAAAMVHLAAVDNAAAGDAFLIP